MSKYDSKIKVMFCTCKNAYQDKTYGLQQRVFNAGKASGLYRCTVCGAEK